MRKIITLILFLFTLSICCSFFSVDSVFAEDGVGAYIERVSFTNTKEFTWYIPPRSELIIVDGMEQVYSSYIDKGQGLLITALHLPDIGDTQYRVFYSDSAGLSSRIPFQFSQSTTSVLMPPTIYSIPNVNDQSGALGFIGSSFPGSLVNVEIYSYSNEKYSYNSLANTYGEWQILPPKLSPGKYQAKAYSSYQGLQSDWSQEVFITILAPSDQLIKDFGDTTRESINLVVDYLPSPLQKAVKEIDKQSGFTSKYIFPTLLSLSTIAQSGLLMQNLLYLLYQLLLGLGQLLGIVKKRQPLGLVYDSVTKLPLGRAIVRLYRAQDHHLVETDVTSASGVFSFMPQEGYYYIRASKPGYVFPSQIVLSTRDGKYSPVYLGGEIRVSSNSAIVNVVVPLDPVAYQETVLMKLNRIWQKWIIPLNRWLLLMGFFLSLLSFSNDPSRLNFVILGLYLAGMYYYWSQERRIKREFGLVVNSLGKPLSGVELILTDTEYNRLVSRRVTDEKGRYQFVVPAGKYQIRMVSPSYEMVTSIRGSYQGNELKIEGERGQSKHISPKIVVRNTLRE